jgi:hypothetical protein
VIVHIGNILIELETSSRKFYLDKLEKKRTLLYS